MRPIASDAEWIESRVAGLPTRWQRRLSQAWKRRSETDYYGANVDLREATAALLTVRLPLDASDSEICDAADRQARRCIDRLGLTSTIEQARAAMELICHGQGIPPPPREFEDRPAIARMGCPLWWRRRLRKHQGQTVEGAAVRLGYVSRFRDLYVSNERLASRLQQNRRNTATLESTLARNEAGQVFTLNELATTSTANKAIRRAELMTRMVGFERYAEAEGHQGVFITLTCPSRFHRYLMVNDCKTAVPNSNYDPKETPGTGHLHLARVWARARAAMKRKKLQPYGFRISEPQHDGTPHWHLLVFCPRDQVDDLIAVLRKYALQDSPDESGARKRRCDFKLMDKKIGTATGYIAKYIAKNIDGEHVGDDLEGRPAIESAKRVEAWAATWRIRQFQQVGGPSVSVWRELRRVRKLPPDAPEHLQLAHRAANKQIQRDGDEAATVAWDAYCRAQGGTACGRNAAIKIAVRPVDTLGRYGDQQAPRPVGIETAGFLGSQESSVRVVASERQKWTIERAPTRRLDWRSFHAVSARPAQPWTRVNNCTGENPTVPQLADADWPRDRQLAETTKQQAGWFSQNECETVPTAQPRQSRWQVFPQTGETSDAGIKHSVRLGSMYAAVLERDQGPSDRIF